MLRALRPLKTKMHFYSGVKVLLAILTAGGLASLLLSVISLFTVVPFTQLKILVIQALSIPATLIVSLFIAPSEKKVMLTADSLGLKERVITAWYLMDNNSSVAELQRKDTENALRRINLSRAYKASIPKKFYIPALALIIAAFAVSFIPGRVLRETQLREKLITKVREQEKQIEEKVKEQENKHPGMSEQQLKELQEALEKLKEELKKAKTEEDALKALAQMENLMKKLESQDPLKDLAELENALAGSALSEELADAMKNEDEEALREALEQLKKELEEAENMEELAELLKQAAQNMDNSSMMAEALRELAASAVSNSAGIGELTQSLSSLIQQAKQNAGGNQEFQQAAAEVGEASAKARRVIASVDRNAALGESGQNGSRTGEQQGQNQGQGQGQGNQSQQNQSGNSGSQGQGQQGGSGAGEGSTGEDAGYNEGDQPGAGRAPGSRKENEYRRIYVPERLGGEGNESALSGQKLESGSSTFSEADGAPVQKGAMVPWQEVLSDYREEAVRSMDRQQIPAGMKSLVRDYFSSLE